MFTFPMYLKKLQRIIEFAANLAIVVSVVVGATVWIRRSNTIDHLPANVLTESFSQFPQLGTEIALPGIDWSTHKATLVVAISPTCHYCIASTPFYSQITHSTHVAPIIIVMPQGKQEAQAFLDEHSIAPRNVVSASLASIQVNATPTLLLVSSSGVVTKEWVGELSDIQRQDVMRSLDQT